MDAAIGPVDWLALGDKLLRLGVAQPTRIGKSRGDLFIAVELGEIGLVAYRHHQHLTAFLRLANAPQLYPRALRSQQPHVIVDVFGVVQYIRRAYDVV